MTRQKSPDASQTAASDAAGSSDRNADAERARKKAAEDAERRQRNDRRESDDRRREPRVLVDTGEKRPDRRNGPRRNSD